MSYPMVYILLKNSTLYSNFRFLILKYIPIGKKGYWFLILNITYPI
uniref:Uncharacterized protein n=1 Tax=Arundo donax TaxID=35708 RepID=A0A0A9HJH3_ARUDO